MLSLRDQLLPIVQGARGLVGDLGMHQVQVVVRTRTWTGGHVQTGASTVADLVLGAPSLLTPGAIVPPHVKGSPADPVVVVGPVTPYHPVTAPRGFTPLQLSPADGAGVEYYYLITFPNGVQRRYFVAPRGLDATRPMRIMVKLEAIDLDFPF